MSVSEFFMCVALLFSYLVLLGISAKLGVIIQMLEALKP